MLHTVWEAEGITETDAWIFLRALAIATRAAQTAVL